MKALIVLTQPPLLEGGAPGKCAVGLLRGLMSHGIEVQALASRQHFAIRGDVPADLPVEIVPVLPEPKTWKGYIRRWRRPRGELGRSALAARVRDAAQTSDLIHLEETETAWCDEELRIPSVAHLHFLARQDRPMGAPWKRQFREVLESDLAERAAIRRHRYLVASSPVIATALRRRAPSSEIVLSPLSLDPADYVPAPLDGPPTAGIIGTAGWPPTASAMKNLVTRIWPAVQTRVPEARLLVGGRGTGGLALPSGRNVEVVGEVESARQFFRQLSVLLYPLDQGSGMKVKVLESIASGVPVVTTPSGSEGIDAESGIVVETDDRRLADAAVAILSDAAERRERGRTARASFERLYTPAAATAPLADLYRRMVGS